MMTRKPSGDGRKSGTRQTRTPLTQQGAATPGKSASSAAGNVAEPRTSPLRHQRAGRRPSPTSDELGARARQLRWGRLLTALGIGRQSIAIALSGIDLLNEGDVAILIDAGNMLEGIEQRAWDAALAEQKRK